MSDQLDFPILKCDIIELSDIFRRESGGENTKTLDATLVFLSRALLNQVTYIGHGNDRSVLKDIDNTLQLIKTAAKEAGYSGVVLPLDIENPYATRISMGLFSQMKPDFARGFFSFRDTPYDIDHTDKPLRRLDMKTIIDDSLLGLLHADDKVKNKWRSELS